MSYALGGLISATDYNILGWGGTQGTYTATPNNIAYVMGVGNGQNGYGQDVSLINTVTASVSTVTAVQWQGLLYLLNRGLGHQGQTQIASGGNINATAGQTITYFANVYAAANTINTNGASFYAQGSTTSGTNYAPNPTAAVNTAYGESTVASRTVTFASADAARYFFNAGGQLNYRVTSTVNNNSTSRSGGIVALGNPSVSLRNTTASVNGGAYTTGNGSNAYGYRSLPTSPVVITQLTETGTYSGDFIKIYLATNGINSGGNGDYGSAITFYYNLYSAGHGAWNTALNITVNHQVDIVYPETTYLTTTWGTPSVS